MNQQAFYVRFSLGNHCFKHIKATRDIAEKYVVTYIIFEMVWLLQKARNYSRHYMLAFHYYGLLILHIHIHQQSINSRHSMLSDPVFQLSDTKQQGVDELSDILCQLSLVNNCLSYKNLPGIFQTIMLARMFFFKWFGH